MVRQAVGALQSGNAFQARQLFEQIVRVPDPDPTAWLGLAFACAQQNDADAALAAVDRLLELEPDNIRGNIFKGDHLEHTGDSRAATQFYQAALRLAARTTRTTNHPEDVLQGLERAQKACKQLEGEYQDFLLKRIGEEGFDLGSTSLRFRQSLDILFGKADVFYQQPRRFYFPGLPLRRYGRHSARGSRRPGPISRDRHRSPCSPACDHRPESRRTTEW
jgi:tetratricopeptide (TPR) repeat protein